LDTFRRKAFAFQPHQINTANLGGIAIGNHKRRNILHNLRAPAGNGEPSNAAKLMDGGEPSHDRVITHLHVTGQRAVIGKNNTVSHRTIVPDVTVSQEIATISNDRLSFTRGA